MSAAKTDKKYFYFKDSDQVREYLRCSQDPVYFIRTYIMIQHAVKGKIPFGLFPFQIKLLQIYLTYRFSVTLKPRQMGISTLVCAYVLWLCLFHPYKIVSMISIKSTVARNLLRKVKFMYAGLPDFFKMEVVNGGGDKIGSADRIAWANGSEINAEAATENAGRSEALSLLVMDEVAFQRYASRIWASAEPTLTTGGSAILLSTAFGIGNLFHQTYTNAVAGVNSFYPVRLNWRMHPERTMEWYQQSLRNLGAKRMAQEVDCDFLQSGYNVFEMEKIKAIEDKLLLHEEQRLSQGLFFKEEEGGRFKQYFKVDPNENYYIGGDVASGRARDFSAFSIMNGKGQEAACFKGKLGVREFGHMMGKYGQVFNNALVAPESNAIGEGVLATLQENGYPNIYNRISKTLRLDDFEKDESMVMGWLTTGKTRHEIITGMDDDLNDELVDIYNPFFVQEAMTFIYSGINNKPIAAGKETSKDAVSMMYDEDDKQSVYTDDSILAACITNEIRKAPGRYKGALGIS